jgi:hypothetical protein
VPEHLLTFPKLCGCGRSWSAGEWQRLRWVGVMDDGVDSAELRHCICGSTISMLTSVVEKAHVVSGDGELRGELFRLRVEPRRSPLLTLAPFSTAALSVVGACAMSMQNAKVAEGLRGHANAISQALRLRRRVERS